MSTRSIVLTTLGVVTVLTLLATWAVVKIAVDYQIPTSVDLRKG